MDAACCDTTRTTRYLLRSRGRSARGSPLPLRTSPSTLRCTRPPPQRFHLYHPVSPSPYATSATRRFVRRSVATARFLRTPLAFTSSPATWTSPQRIHLTTAHVHNCPYCANKRGLPVRWTFQDHPHSPFFTDIFPLWRSAPATRCTRSPGRHCFCALRCSAPLFCRRAISHAFSRGAHYLPRSAAPKHRATVVRPFAYFPTHT